MSHCYCRSPVLPTLTEHDGVLEIKVNRLKRMPVPIAPVYFLSELTEHEGLLESERSC